MKGWILPKNSLSYWLRQLRKDSDLIGPLRTPDGDIVFESVEKIHEIVLDPPASLPSVKEFFLPQYETVFVFKTDTVRPIQEKRKRVIFGLRSCDVAALRLLDRFFLDSQPDPYYSERRKNTLLISVVCNRPDPTCFCVGIGAGPYLKEGFDIQLTDLGDRYMVEIGSPRGRRAVREYSFVFQRPRKTDLEDQFEVQLSSTARFQQRINLEGVRSLILSQRVDEGFWQEVANRCIQCGGCVYVCPLCSCFTVTDRVYQEHIERVRLWDACLFKGFTRLAGGILPNDAPVSRTKRWFYHKLIYYPEGIGGFGCVGCGRCAVVCPSKIDMATVVLNIKRVSENAVSG